MTDLLPLVSIALCTYNGERYLIQQLDTLIDQTYQNIEIIAVDDCSTDRTFSILQDYAAKYDNFHIYKNKQNVGFAKNFEIALGYCSGEFIALADQDDLWYPEKITLQINAIGSNQIIYHDSERIDEQNNLLHKKISDFLNFYRGGEPEVFLLSNCVSGHTMLLRKDLVKHALPFNKDYYHDWWLTYVAVNLGTIDYIPQCLVKYRQHEESSTRKDVLTQAQRIVQDIKWLGHCFKFPLNKHPEFVKTLYDLYSQYPQSVFTSIQLWWFLEKNMDILYYTVKKSRKQKLKDIRRFLWGVKARNFWDVKIKHKPQKPLEF